jgi:uncharacterized delta-60 repeat protein
MRKTTNAIKESKIMKNLIIKTTLTAIAIAIFTFQAFAAAGDLDLSFSTDGFELTQLGDGDDIVTATAIQPDGKIVVAGTSGANANSQVALARYKEDGSLDTTFGIGGKVSTRNIANLLAKSVAIQTDGKIIVAGRRNSRSSTQGFVVFRYNTNGTLDNTFGNSGIVTTPLGNRRYIGGSVAILPDGNLILAGGFETGLVRNLVVIKYKTNGSLAQDFGNAGIVITPSATLNGFAISLAIQQSGRIVVVGSAFNNDSRGDFAVVRYLVNGDLDTSFGTGGIVITPHGTGTESATDVKIQLNGDIVVAGVSFGVPSGRNIAVLRYKSNGDIDTSFGNNGIVTEPQEDSPFYEERDVSLAIQLDGKFVVSGFDDLLNSTRRHFFILRYNSNGSLDSSFDSDGKVRTQILTRDGHPTSLLIQSDGKILASGTSGDFASVRYNTNGSLDTTFNTDGILITNNFSTNAQIKAVALQSDGKIVVTGVVFDGIKTNFTTARYNTNGSFDSTFSNDGIVTTSVGTSLNSSNAVSIQTDGKVVIAGEAKNGSNFEIVVIRYTANGVLDTTFDSDGILTTSSPTGNIGANSLAIQSNGRIVVAGYATTGASSLGFAVVRYNSNGTLDTTFNTDGILITSIGTRFDIANSVAIQSDGKIVVAGNTSIVNANATNNFAVVRYNINGTLDTTFNTDGISTVAIFSTCIAESLAIDSSGKIIVAGGAIAFGIAPINAFALARFTTNGNLDSTFDTDGIVTTEIFSDTNTLDDVVKSVAVQQDGKIVAAGIGSSAFLSDKTNEDFAIVRYNSNGSLDTTSFTENTSELFGTNGIVTKDFSDRSDETIEGIVIQPDGKIIAVGHSDQQFAIARYQGLAPTAATAAINGRVSTASGRAIRNVSILLTDSTTGETKYTHESIRLLPFSRFGSWAKLHLKPSI